MQIFKILTIITILVFTSEVKADDSVSIGIGNDGFVCAAVFPCHIKTGRLLPNFTAGTECQWEKVCENYRQSPQYKKLRSKLLKQKRISKRNNIKIRARNS